MGNDQSKSESSQNCSDQRELNVSTQDETVIENSSATESSLCQVDDDSDSKKKNLNLFFRVVELLSNYNIKFKTQFAIQTILEGMKDYFMDEQIQTDSSGTLYCIARSKAQKDMDDELRRDVINAVLDSILLMFHSCRIFFMLQLQVPKDVYFYEYKRLVQILLLILSNKEQELAHFFAALVLSQLGCEVNYGNIITGDAGTIDLMLKLIENRLRSHRCDILLLLAWGTLWNLTDRSLENSRLVVEGRGIDLFINCLRLFKGRDELIHYMIGPIANVAEEQTLRPRLMTEEFISVVNDQLDSKSSTFKVRAQAASILCLILSDSPDQWTIESTSRNDVLSRISIAVRSWDIEETLFANYNSLEPILRLLRIDCAQEVQYWAVWTLANLTFKDPEKYCALLQEENGLELLEDLIYREFAVDEARTLALQVITRCESRLTGQ